MRSLLAFALCMLAAVAGAQQKVSFSSPATSIGKLMPALSKAAGTRLEAAPAIQGEILILRLKDASLDETMKRIAGATSGAWRKTENGFMLEPDRALRARDQAAETAAFEARLDAILKKMAKDV